MNPISVTLDVSKLSGWLNADANCRVERGAYEVGVRPVRRRRAAERRRRKRQQGKGPTVEIGRRVRAKSQRTESILLMVVTLDVSRLSGWLNADANCQVEKRI